MPKIEIVKPEFVARVLDVDLRQEVADAAFEQIRDAFNHHAILVFPGQDLSNDQQIAFSERFGPLEPSVRRHRKRNVANIYVSDLSNIDPDTGGFMADSSEAMSYNLGNQLWHSDSSFKQVPAQASLLSGREVPPEGGETEFADLRAAWDTLDAERQQWLGKQTAKHSLAHSRGKMGYDAAQEFTGVEKAEVPPVVQPMMFKNANTGRKALYVGAHAFSIVGMGDEEGLKLIDELIAHATQAQFVYAHQWHENDLVMWDNRASLHRGRPWDTQRYRRVMRRTTVAGPGFVEAA
jgi:alpha-ketoglutarate-dependent 2,4-dichlorophenoxyacetate dioxygenase